MNYKPWSRSKRKCGRGDPVDKTTETPTFIIRASVPPMPTNWITPDYQVDAGLQNSKVSDYLAANHGDNKSDAETFCFIEASATVEPALTKMGSEKVDDLFITADGKSTSRVLGWATRYSLRKTLT